MSIRLTAGRAALMILSLAASPLMLTAQQSDTDLTEISLDNLLNVQVTSVSRRQEELRNTAAAVYVITQEDIRRSGVTDIAELLRMVPGVDVAQINSSAWAVSVRGFINRTVMGRISWRF